MTKKRILLSVVLFLGFVLPCWAETLPVIPRAKGFGMHTRAAYGDSNNPEIRIVTTLDDNTTPLAKSTRNGVAVKIGSFRQCVQEESPSNTGVVILFEVGGTSDATGNGRIRLRQPYFTIAGQTAPSPGFTLKGEPLELEEEAHDVLVQHIRVRVGDDPASTNPAYRDAIGHGASNTVFDHVSASWSLDEIAGGATYTEGQTIDNVTYRYCIFSEGLANPKLYDSDKAQHPDISHSSAFLAANGNIKISLIKNLFAHNFSRNPRLSAVGMRTYQANNVIYNYGGKNPGDPDGYGRDQACEFTRPSIDTTNKPKHTVIGNYYKAGPNTETGAGYAVRVWNGTHEIYLKDIICPTGTDWDCFEPPPKNSARKATEAENKVLTPPVTLSGFTPLSAMMAYEYVLKNVGARPADRDAVDGRIINEVNNGTGSIINSQDEVGGWPVVEHTKQTLDLTNNPHADYDDDGYTNLEEWLHNYSDLVEERKSSEALAAPQGLNIVGG